MAVSGGETFTLDIHSEAASRLRKIVLENLARFSESFSDDVLAEYVVVLVAHGKSRDQTREDLEAFLGDKATEFIAWLWDFLNDNHHLLTSTADDSGQEKAGDSGMEMDQVHVEERLRGPEEAILAEGGQGVPSAAMPDTVAARGAGLRTQERDGRYPQEDWHGRGREREHQGWRERGGRLERGPDRGRMLMGDRSDGLGREERRRRDEYSSRRGRGAKHEEGLRCSSVSDLDRPEADAAAREGWAAAAREASNELHRDERRKRPVSALGDIAMANSGGDDESSPQGRRTALLPPSARPSSRLLQTAMAQASRSVSSPQGAPSGAAAAKRMRSLSAAGEGQQALQGDDGGGVPVGNDEGLGSQEAPLHQPSGVVDDPEQELHRGSRVAGGGGGDAGGVVVREDAGKEEMGEREGQARLWARLGRATVSARENGERGTNHSNRRVVGRGAGGRLLVRQRLGGQGEDQGEARKVEVGIRIGKRGSVKDRLGGPSTSGGAPHVAVSDHATEAGEEQEEEGEGGENSMDDDAAAFTLAAAAATGARGGGGQTLDVEELKRRIRTVQLDMIKIKAKQSERERDSGETDAGFPASGFGRGHASSRLHQGRKMPNFPGGRGGGRGGGGEGAGGGPSGWRAAKLESDERSVFVSNVHFSATSAKLSQHFKECGSVSRCTVLIDPITALPMGCGYVEFTDAEAAAKALSLSGSSFLNRAIKVFPKLEAQKNGLIPAPSSPFGSFAPTFGAFPPQPMSVSFGKLKSGSKEVGIAHSTSNTYSGGDVSMGGTALVPGTGLPSSGFPPPVHTRQTGSQLPPQPFLSTPPVQQRIPGQTRQFKWTREGSASGSSSNGGAQQQLGEAQPVSAAATVVASSASAPFAAGSSHTFLVDSAEGAAQAARSHATRRSFSYQRNAEAPS